MGGGTLLSGLRTALSLLTRIPVGSAEPEMRRSVRWFPAVGALVGLVVGGLDALGELILPDLLSATVAVSAGVILTGAFHEDGLADTADALGAGSPEDALRILRDPRHGTYGVTAIVLGVTVRVAALTALAGWAAVAALPAAHALSRTASAWMLAAVRPAAPQGLGAGYARSVERRDVVIAVVLGVAIGTAAMGPWVAAAVGVTALGAGAVAALAVRRFGGITGDLLGAAQQVGEISVLVLAATLAANGWWSPGW